MQWVMHIVRRNSGVLVGLWAASHKRVPPTGPESVKVASLVELRGGKRGG